MYGNRSERWIFVLFHYALLRFAATSISLVLRPSTWRSPIIVHTYPLPLEHTCCKQAVPVSDLVWVWARHQNQRCASSFLEPATASLGLAPIPCCEVVLQALRDIPARAVLLVFSVPLDSLGQRCFGGHSVVLMPDLI